MVTVNILLVRKSLHGLFINSEYLSEAIAWFVYKQ